MGGERKSKWAEKVRRSVCNLNTKVFLGLYKYILKNNYFNKKKI